MWFGVSVAGFLAVVVVHHSVSLRLRWRSARATRAHRLLTELGKARARRCVLSRSRRWLVLTPLAGVALIAGSSLIAPPVLDWFPRLPMALQMFGTQWSGIVLVIVGGILLRGMRVGFAPHCPRCDQDLTGVPRPLSCPECGMVVPRNPVRRGRLERHRVEGGAAVAVGVVVFVGGMLIRFTPIPGLVASVAHTDALIMSFAGHMVAIASFEDAYEAELMSRMARDPRVQTRTVRWLADILAGDREDRFSYFIRDWGVSSVQSGALTGDEIEMLARGAHRGVRRGVEDAPVFWQALQAAAPEVVERVRSEGE